MHSATDMHKSIKQYVAVLEHTDPHHDVQILNFSSLNLYLFIMYIKSLGNITFLNDIY